MSMATSGFDPVAELREEHGDVYQLADWLTDEIDSDEFVFLAVSGGPLYLARPVTDPADAHLVIDVEIRDGMTGAWDSETDKLAHQLPESAFIVDVIGEAGRYLVTENDD